jgi:putative FmdB family regulatory protein
MPIYEFKCIQCKNEFEELQLITDKNPNCPECNSATDKIISRSLGVVKSSSNRSIDCLVGADAEKKWAIHYNRIEKRKQK